MKLSLKVADRDHALNLGGVGCGPGFGRGADLRLMAGQRADHRGCVLQLRSESSFTIDERFSRRGATASALVGAPRNRNNDDSSSSEKSDADRALFTAREIEVYEIEHPLLPRDMNSLCRSTKLVLL